MVLVGGILAPNIALTTGQCIEVNRVVVQGVSKKLQRPVGKIANKFKERCLSSKDIQDLMRQITNF
jgi:hemolysin activation/secretion protein